MFVRHARTWARALTVAAALAATMAGTAQAQEKVLRAALHADVRTLDPFWTTQTIAGIHGMIIYDTLFGNDDDVRPHPQMVDRYEISDDRKTYTFVLRDGLKFHDGSPVGPKDAIASLRRWGAKDGVGQRLLSFIERFDVVDAKTFKMVLKAPYGMVLETLGKTGTSVPVIMRERDAMVDPNTQIAEAIGSGPFRFAKDLWVPGSKTVYLKNADYVPRPGNEKASSFAGSKFAGVAGLEQALLKRPDLFVTALTEKLLTFALGRGVEASDAPAVRKIVRGARADGYRFSSILLGVAESTPFTMRKAP